MKSISIILTIHNKEELARQVVTSILQYASAATRELIIIFDGCSDRSEEYAMATIAEHSRDITLIIEHAPDVFETRSNNIGLKKSTCDYSLLIQDDMVMQEPEFDLRLIKPLLAFSDCFASSGRAAHNDVITLSRRRKFRDYFMPRRETVDFTDLVGRENNLGRNVFGIRDVVNRGPLVLDNIRLEKLDYLDETFAPYVYDDHDLCLRAFSKFGWLCGSYVIGYQSENEWGSTRQKNAHIYRAALKKNEHLLIERYRDLLCGPKHNENRLLD
jgi:glycosyltransferase involved in cell wall biosynthesis